MCSLAPSSATGADVGATAAVAVCRCSFFTITYTYIYIFITETFECSKMAGDREDNVYKAKLAEQAERYDGKRPTGSDKIKGFVCCHREDVIAVL